MAAESALAASHLIVYVANTDASIAFWCRGMGGVLEQDGELEAPALDAMFGRKGVRIRDTFIRIGGVRLHTIEPLDVRDAQVSRSSQGREAAAQRGEAERSVGPREGSQASEGHRAGARKPARSAGIDGLSFAVPDIESAHARAAAEGLRPTPIYDFTAIETPCRMFFLDDPDGIRVEMIEYVR
jgi:catechol 2,3-dioxygenase-like lactoylglutathione lyase family enzyme